MMDNRTTNNVGQFYWWFGVVEDRDDPLRMGRCRVRIMGYHIDSKEQLPTEDLPWAMPIMPANNPSISGVGGSANGVVTGTWVVGFFADGSDGQHPMFFGTVGAVPGGLDGDDCIPAGGNSVSEDGGATGTFTPPAGNAKSLEEYLENFLDTNGKQLTNWGPMAKAQIMAQCAHESDNFKTLTEYASGSAYEGRKDLGNIKPGDGVKYKGRGYIQITGRSNYTQSGQYIKVDIVNNPNQAATKEIAAMLVLWFFLRGNARNVGSKNQWSNVAAVTKKVNGGDNGLADRIKKFEHYKRKYGIA